MEKMQKYVAFRMCLLKFVKVEIAKLPYTFNKERLEFEPKAIRILYLPLEELQNDLIAGFTTAIEDLDLIRAM